MPFDLDLTSVQPLLNRISAVFSPATSNEILLIAGTKAGLKAEELIQEKLYPPASGKPLALWYTRERAPKPNGESGGTYKSKFKSMAQQRYVMALVARGKVPYRRSGQLGRSIVSRARLTGDGLLVIDIGSRMAYSIYVIDRKFQSRYHTGTWQTVQDDFDQGLPAIVLVARSTVVKEVERRLQRG